MTNASIVRPQPQQDLLAAGSAGALAVSRRRAQRHIVWTARSGRGGRTGRERRVLFVASVCGAGIARARRETCSCR